MGCPVAHDFDLLDPAWVVDPYPVLNAWRADAGVLRPRIDHFVVTRFDEVVQVLLDRETWSAANASSP